MKPTSHNSKALMAMGLIVAMFLSTFVLTSTADADDSMAFSKAQNAKTEFVTAGNVKYAYRLVGKKTGVPLLMLTRFRANMDDWDPAFINELGKERPVIVFNNAGVASSTGEVPTTIKGAADHAATLAKALGYNEVDILGWSMAGFTVQVMAMDYPGLVRNMVIVGSGPGGSAETSPPARPEVFGVATKTPVNSIIWEEPDHQFLFFAPDSEVGKKAVAASLKRINAGRRSDEEPVTTTTVMERQNQAIAAFWWEAKDDRYFQRLKEIKQPTLIVNGDRDAFFDLKGQWLLHREIPNSQVAIYPMAGHGPQHQYPKHCGEMINKFLSSNP